MGIPNMRTMRCALCGKPTTMLGTQRCDDCYELETRIQRDPLKAILILRLAGYTDQMRAATKEAPSDTLANYLERNKRT